MGKAPFLLATLAVCANAHAAVIYKSIERDGRITFSDVPIPEAIAVQRIAMSDGATPSTANPTSASLANELDEAVLAANNRMDLAERAFADARRAAGGPDPMALGVGRPSAEDRARVDSSKREVLAARRSLLRAIDRRNNERL